MCCKMSCNFDLMLNSDMEDGQTKDQMEVNNIKLCWEDTFRLCVIY